MIDIEQLWREFFAFAVKDESISVSFSWGNADEMGRAEIGIGTCGDLCACDIIAFTDGLALARAAGMADVTDLPLTAEAYDDVKRWL